MMPKSSWKAPADPEALKDRIVILRGQRKRLKKQLDQYVEQRRKKKLRYLKKGWPHTSFEYRIKTSEYYQMITELERLKVEIRSCKNILIKRYDIKI